MAKLARPAMAATAIEIGDPRPATRALRESKARLHALLSSLDDLVFELDENGIYLGVWTANETLLAAPRHELLGRSVRDVIGEELGASLIEIIRHVLATGCPEIWDFCLDVPAGARWFQGRLAPITTSGAPSERICLLVRDTTTEKTAEREIARLLSREQLLSRLSEAVPVGLFEIDTTGRVTFSNDLLRTIVGGVPAATIGASMSSVIAEDRPILEAALAAVLADELVDDFEIRLRSAAEDARPTGGGGDRVCLLSLRALTDSASVVTGAVGCLTDVTERVQLRHELEVRASVDQLTSCLNRAAFLELLEWTTSQPQAAGEGCALIFIDLDRFKSVNDRFGHAAGDGLLAAAANRLRGAVRDCDDIGRFGGDEFVVICPRVQGSAHAVALAERVAGAMTTTLDVGPGLVELRTSVGVAWTAEALDADTFIAQADSAMYESKRTRGNRVTLFTPASDGTSQTPLREPPRTRRAGPR
jgi:diguanylate cyclase (GGDEF)-like protein/PAS domain S-box-containing protein